MQREGIKGKKR